MMQRWGARWLLGCLAIAATGASHHLILVPAQAAERDRLDEQARQLVVQWQAVQSERSRINAELAQLQADVDWIEEEPETFGASPGRTSLVWWAAQSSAPLTRWSVGDATAAAAPDTFVLEGPYEVVLGFLRLAALDAPSRPLRRLTLRRRGEADGWVVAEVLVGSASDAAGTEF